MNETRQQRSHLRIVIAIILAAVLVVPLWQSARNGLSDLYARPAIDFLEEKRFEGYAISLSDWQAIETNVLHANELMPGNPQYLEALGHLQQLKLSLFASKLSASQTQAHASAAHDYYRQAIANRPTWPYYWGNVALEHYRRGNFTADDYSHALANTSRFGPWKNDAQRLILDLGGDTWDFLSAQAKFEFVLNLERSLHRQPENTLQIMREFNQWADICGFRADISLPHLNSLCVRIRSSELPRN